MKSPCKPIDKVTIDQAGSEKLSDEINDAVDQIRLSIHIRNPKSVYVHLIQEGFELKIRWTRAVAGIAGIIGLIKLIFLKNRREVTPHHWGTGFSRLSTCKDT
jgi:hypothetical protein